MFQMLIQVQDTSIFQYLWIIQSLQCNCLKCPALTGQIYGSSVKTEYLLKRTTEKTSRLKLVKIFGSDTQCMGTQNL